jgi:hypothetical protein
MLYVLSTACLTSIRHISLPADLQSSNFAVAVQVFVENGEAQERYLLHEHLLRKGSVLFEQELNIAWRTSDMKTVLVHDPSLSAVTGIVKFLYTGA